MMKKTGQLAMVCIATFAMGCGEAVVPSWAIADATEDKSDDPSDSSGTVTVQTTDDGWTTVTLSGPYARRVRRIFANHSTEIVVVDNAPFFTWGEHWRCSSEDRNYRCAFVVRTEDFEDLRHRLDHPSLVRFAGGAADELLAATDLQLLNPYSDTGLVCESGVCAVRKRVGGVADGSLPAHEILEIVNKAPPPTVAAIVGANAEAALRASPRFPFQTFTELANTEHIGPRELAALGEWGTRAAYQRANSGGLGCSDFQRWLAAPGDQSALASITADANIQKEEAEALVQRLANQPAYANATARAVLAALADPATAIDPDGRQILSESLAARFGYRTELLAKNWSADAVRQLNVTEIDDNLECVLDALSAQTNRVIVAVLDGGTILEHPASQLRIARNRNDVPGNGIDDDQNGLSDDVFGWNFRGGGSPNDLPAAQTSHGLHVAAIAGRGTHRIAVLNLQDNLGFDDASSVASARAQAIHYAAQQGARVINISQVTIDDVATEVIAAMAANPDILFVVGSGNDGGEVRPNSLRNHAIADAGLPNVLLVAAADLVSGAPADYSNFHAQLVDVAMPGDWLSADFAPQASYSKQFGTSQAAPSVANLAAKLLLVDPTLSATQIVDILYQATVLDSRWTGVIAAGGVIDPDAALQLAVAPYGEGHRITH